ncbi:hypothetical protein [Flavobacterium croceum]|uniref:hypothetical protein n=1 Tax=Flavobacterium croceum TaxID=370975 RepID=UPI0024A882E2|nr:hypothetical protein [Flavobacterium croceum]
MKYESSINKKIDVFFKEFKRSGGSIKSVYLSDIIETLKGVTNQSTLVAEAIEKGIINKRVLEDELFESIYKTFSKKSPKNVSAFAIDGITYYRESTPVEIFFKEIVHEGTHILDDVSRISDNLIALRENTGKIIHQEETMAKYIKNLNKKQLIEFRARIFEREFEIAAKLDLDFKKIEDMIKFIKNIIKINTMNDKIKIINEMLHYIDDSENKVVLLKEAEKKITRESLYPLIRDLLLWNNPFYIKLHKYDSKQMFLLNEGIKTEYKQNMELLLESCSDLKNIFVIKGDTLVFKNDITEEEINEIRTYIEKNKKIYIQSKETRMRR